MKPKISECEKKQRELLRPRLDSFLNMKHELVQLSDCIDWESFVNKFGAYFYEQKGRPGLPVRLVVGLTYLKYLYPHFSQTLLLRGSSQNSLCASYPLFVRNAGIQLIR